MVVDVPFRPLYCVWELTLACNLRCTHCGSSAGQARPRELSTAECLDVVGQLADLGCRLITLSGGEPTLRDDWEDVARAARARGVTVNMVTNGTTIGDALARRVAAAGLANVAVSIDGPEALHDEIRGRGSFRRATAGLARLRAAGVPTAVLTHLDRRSAPRIEEIHEIARAAGARMFRLQLCKPMGNLAPEEARAHLLEPRDLVDLLPRIARLKRRSELWVDVGDSIGYFGPDERTLRAKGWGGMRSGWTGCQAGRYAIGIESDGGVKGCLSLQARLEGATGDAFREGDLRRRRLADLWFAPGAFAWNRAPGLDRLTGACRRCAHAAICRGGARCVAVAFTGRLGEDPYCYHRVAVLQSRRGALGRSLARHAAAAAVGLGLGAPAASVGGGAGLGVGVGVGAGVGVGVGLGLGVAVGAVGALGAGCEGPPRTRPDARPSSDPCAPPCPDCDYGVLPSECYADAAAIDGGAAAADAAAIDGGAAAADASAATPDADPCADVCCDCDYGVIPPGCCPPTPDAAPDPCDVICCDCEYGVPPPPECCP